MIDLRLRLVGWLLEAGDLLVLLGQPERVSREAMSRASEGLARSRLLPRLLGERMLDAAGTGVRVVVAELEARWEAEVEVRRKLLARIFLARYPYSGPPVLGFPRMWLAAWDVLACPLAHVADVLRIGQARLWRAVDRAGPEMFVVGPADDPEIGVIDARIVAAGFRPRFSDRGPVALELATSDGPLVITGERYEAGRRRCFSVAAALGGLGEQALRWSRRGSTGLDRIIEVAELIAEAIRRPAEETVRSGDVTLRRVGYGRPIAELSWAGGVSAERADLLTEWVGGRHRQVGFYPVGPDGGYGLLHHPHRYARVAPAVVAIVRNGQIVGTGVVIVAATPTSPAKVLTAWHVAVRHSPHAPLLVDGHQVAGTGGYSIRSRGGARPGRPHRVHP